MLAFGLIGCGDEAASKNAQQPAEADVVIAQPVINGGVGLEEEQKMAREGGALVENWNLGFLSDVALFNGQSVISPQHVGHDLDAANYGIDDEYVCWLEWPGPPDAQTSTWYIYLQPRNGGEAVLLDEGPYGEYTASISRSEAGQGLCLDYEAGNAIWVRPMESGGFQVKLYRSATGETTVLDEFSQMGAQVAIGEEDAIWRRYDDENHLLLMHCDLNTGTMTQLAVWTEDSEWMEQPLICGHYLVMFKGWGNELHVYDFDQGTWTWTIRGQTEAEGQTTLLNLLDKPVALDATHIALVGVPTDGQEAYPLAVADLQNQKVYTVETAPYTPLYYSSGEPNEEQLKELGEKDEYIVTRIQPQYTQAGSPYIYVMMKRWAKDAIYTTVHPLVFHW